MVVMMMVGECVVVGWMVVMMMVGRLRGGRLDGSDDDGKIVRIVHRINVVVNYIG
jgi:hypothetical protein